jgi:hypothetical protein
MLLMALVRTDVSEEHSAPTINLTRIGEFLTMFVGMIITAKVPSNSFLVTLMME